jgi:hypothetical protein
VGNRLSWGTRKGSVNFKTTLHYTVEALITRSRESLEAHMAYVCAFNQAEVEWFEYWPIRFDKADGYIVFEVEGRNKVPIPEDGNVDQLKAAIL